MMATRRRPTALLPFLFGCALCCTPIDASPQEAEMAGLVRIPAGTVHPGATLADINERSDKGKDKERWDSFKYERWGAVKAIHLAEYFLSKYEVTNAQWKHYLDQRYLTDPPYKTKKGDTLNSLAKRFVLHDGRPMVIRRKVTLEGGRERVVEVAPEWRSIYALNQQAVDDAWTKWEEKDKADEKIPEAKKFRIPEVETLRFDTKLPEGLELTFYKHRTPAHWYGWRSVLSGLNVGREYCDIKKKAHEAFRVPEEWTDKELRKYRLRMRDFGACPIRDISPAEILQFCEWYGVHLPTEYEWERAARGDSGRQHRYPWGAKWNRSEPAEAARVSFADNPNPLVKDGPLPVDAASVSGGDSPFGLRNMLGNVYELTRSFMHYHPSLVGAPARDDHTFLYAMVSKGASFGDGWRETQISIRAPKVGNAILAIPLNNRVDTLGFRVCAHARPGYDAMLHTIVRFSYDATGDVWRRPRPISVPHAFALPRVGGVTDRKFVRDDAPYIHLRSKAHAIAVAPLWFCELNQPAIRKIPKRWKKDKSLDVYYVMGVLRVDLPFKAGVRLNPTAAAARIAEIKKLDAQKKKNGKKGKKAEEEEVVEDPIRPPDKYELRTLKRQKAMGLWQERVVPPGEWLVVYWNGYMGLVNSAKIMPPDVIVILDETNGVTREKEAKPAQITVNTELKTIGISLWCEEQLKPAKNGVPHQTPPDDRKDTDQWARAETYDAKWTGWPGRRPGKAAWRLQAVLEMTDAVTKHEWAGSDPAGSDLRLPNLDPKKNNKNKKKSEE